LRRRTAESWTEWYQRVAERLPDERAAQLVTLLERYQEIRYSVTLDEAAARDWIETAHIATTKWSR
jgi:hypothetical protein